MFLGRGSLWWGKFETGLFSDADFLSSEDATMVPRYIKSWKKTWIKTGIKTCTDKFFLTLPSIYTHLFAFILGKNTLLVYPTSMKNPASHAIIAIATFFIALGRGKRRYLLNSSVKKKVIFGLSFFKFNFEKKGDIC